MNEKFQKYTDEQTFSKIVDYESITQMWTFCAKEYAESVAIVDGAE